MYLLSLKIKKNQLLNKIGHSSTTVGKNNSFPKAVEETYHVHATAK